MAIKLWDLAAAEDDRRFSPHCWRVKMALRHKGLEVEEIPWRFTDKEAISASGQGAVPVIEDQGQTLYDSWTIANYLDEAYPDRPLLFSGEEAKTLCFFVKHWVERSLHGPFFRLIVLDIERQLHPKDKAYFRSSREKRFGKTLEDFAGDSEQVLAQLRAALDPLRPVLAESAFLSGRTPGFADYLLIGEFQWARAVSAVKLLEKGDPIFAWRERVMDLFGGYARGAVGYPV